MITGANSKSVNQTSSQLITDWVTSHSYSINDYVQISSQLYKCISAHTSGTFNSDFAAGKWIRMNNDTFSMAMALALG